MKDHPILFSGEMARALLEGRKTQTRRIVKPQPDEDGICLDLGRNQYLDTSERVYRCPYGMPGDRLWVRETWGVGTRPDQIEGWCDGVEYRADKFYLDEHELLPLHPVNLPDNADLEDYRGKGCWRPSIHMPRWASRLTLCVTGIRVERLQAISEQDAMTEGAEPYDVSMLSADELQLLNAPLLDRLTPYKNGFALLWESIYKNWNDNPWVWVVEFVPIEKNIDEVK